MRVLCSAALAAALSFASPVAAAQAADAGAEAFRRQEERDALERRREERAADVFLPRAPALDDVAVLPDETPCFPVRSIGLSGVERFPWLSALVEPYVGACVGRQGINTIVRRLSRALLERGYVTSRIAVPEQDLGDGSLDLVVVPGIIRAIRFSADSAPGGNWETAFPARPGDVLDLRALEQGVEQMKRPPSQDVEIEIVPGATAGESDVVIVRRQARRLRGVLAVDDSGAKATGRYIASATIALDGPFGVNDLAYVAASSALDRDGGKRGNESLTGFYSVPWGWWTFSAAASQFEFRQTIQGVAQSFVSSGESRAVDVRAVRMLHRTGVSKTTLQLRVNTRRSESYIDDVEILAQKRRLTAAEVGLAHRHVLGTTLIDLAVGHRVGVPWFGAEAPLDDANPEVPTSRYRLWTLEALLAAPLDLGPVRGRYTAQFRGQLTRDALFAQDFFSIGNRFTVRGFDGERTLAADRGWFLRNELAVPLALAGHEIYFGIDTGGVGGSAARFLPGRGLTGAVLGVRGGYRGVLYEGFVGMAVAKPDGFPNAHPVLGFQVLYQL